MKTKRYKTKNIEIMEVVFLTICVAIITLLFALSVGVWLSGLKKQMQAINSYVTGKFSTRIIGYEAPEGTVLKKAYHDDVCYDLYTSEDYTLTRKRSAIPTGVKAELGSMCFAFVLPRSGASTKGIPAICVSEDGKRALCRIYGNIIIGTIDTGYRGDIGVIFDCDINPRKSKYTYIIPKGTKIAQLCILQYPNTAMVKVEQVKQDTERAGNGFGHTGYSKEQ